MSRREQRAGFSVFIFLADTEAGSAAKLHLASQNYEAFLFADQDTVLDRVKQAAPHVLVFAAEALMSPLSEFVERILEINSEIQFVFVGPIGQSDAIAEYRDYNFSEFVPAGEYLETRILWAVDKVCEILYLTYVNEKLLSEKEALLLKQKESQVLLASVQSTAAQRTTGSVVDFVNRYKAVQSKEDTLQIFLAQVSCQAIFFRFLPTVQTFVATTAKGIDIESIKGVGARLTEDEFRGLSETLGQGALPKTLDDFMRLVLKSGKYFVQKVQPHKTLEGVFVFWGQGMNSFSAIENEYLVFHLVYQNVHFLKRSELLDINDPVTELFNRNYFHKKLEEEVSRARRLKQPVSVVLLSIDHFVELEQSLGKSNRDLILKSVASIVRKTSRINDLSCRSDENEIAMLLPHSGKKGATLRAERLRRIIESHSFTVNGLKVSVSAGVSEYPMLCSSAEELEAGARQALDFIISRGGNKVCLYQPAQGFLPDYEVVPV